MVCVITGCVFPINRQHPTACVFGRKSDSWTLSDLSGQEKDADVDFHPVQLRILVDRLRLPQLHALHWPHLGWGHDWLQRPISTNFREFLFLVPIDYM